MSSAMLEGVSKVYELTKPQQEPEVEEIVEVPSTCSTPACTKTVLRISREIFSAFGKGALGVGIILSLQDQQLHPNYRVASLVSSVVGVAFMITSSLFGSLANIKCVHKEDKRNV